MLPPRLEETDIVRSLSTPTPPPVPRTRALERRAGSPASLTTVRGRSDVRVLVVDDNVLFAEAIQTALSTKGFHVSIASDVASALARFDDPLAPDVVLVEMCLAGGAGFALGTEILEHHPGSRVIALTRLSDGSAADRALDSGFAAYLTKDAKIDRLADTIWTVASGGTVVPQYLPEASNGDAPPRAGAAALLLAQITPREREILELLSTGSTSREIERTLGISRNTVRTHVQNILAKLGVHSRLQAVAFAVEHGIVPGLVRAT